MEKARQILEAGSFTCVLRKQETIYTENLHVLC